MSDESRNSTGLIIGTLAIVDLQNICVHCSNPELREKAFRWAISLKEFIDSHKVSTNDTGKDICVVLSLP